MGNLNKTIKLSCKKDRMKKVLLYIAGIFFVGSLSSINLSFRNGKNDERTITEAKMANKTIVFSGITWQIRSGFRNPGGNNWSDSAESVWVDNEGKLHMKIRNINGKWYCSEIYSDKTVGYGEYRFYVANNVEKLNKNVVVGLFTYLNDNNEIDIEFSKWGNSTEKNIGHYVTQPANTAGNKHDFDLNLLGNNSTHRFIWEPHRINFKSWQVLDINSSDNPVIEDWDYYGDDIPIPGSEKLCLNIWLYNGMAPDDGNEVEVIIRAVEIYKLPVVSDLNVVIPEDTTVASVLGKLIAPGYNSDELTYYIIEGNANGIFSVSKNGEIILEKLVDYETSPLENFVVLVAKGDLTDTVLVNIEITNVFELGLQSTRSYFDVEIYPNPATSLLNIDFNNDINVDIQVINSEGKIIQVKEVSRSKGRVVLNISELKSGNYLVLLKYQNKTEILKFSKVLHH